MEKFHEKSQTSKKKVTNQCKSEIITQKNHKKRHKSVKKKHRLVIMYLNLRVYLFLFVFVVEVLFGLFFLYFSILVMFMSVLRSIM